MSGGVNTVAVDSNVQNGCVLCRCVHRPVCWMLKQQKRMYAQIASGYGRPVLCKHTDQKSQAAAAAASGVATASTVPHHVHLVTAQRFQLD
jgi:hypothetical protein